MAGVQYNYEPIDPNAISDYLSRDYYTPAPQGGIPLPPRRPPEMYGYGGADLQYSPVEQRELNAAYRGQSWQDQARNLMPAAMQAYVGTRLYPDEFQEITQRNFGPSETNALRQEFDRRASSYYTGGFGVNPLQGFQRGRVPDVSQFVPYDPGNAQHVRPFVNYSQTLVPDTQMSGPESMFQGIEPFTRGAYYQQSPEGIRMRNTYSSPFGQRDINVLLPMEPR
jgi:hypothetical protein